MEDKLKEAVKTYNKIASIYANFTEDQLLQFQLAKFESLLKGKKILDAGCGPGRDSCYFSDDGFEVTGVDLSKEFVKKAKERCEKAEFLIKDLRKITYKEEFDGVWFCAGLVHSNKEDAKKILSKLFKSLKKEGILFITTKKGKGSKEIERKEFNEKFTYYFYEKEEMQEMLTEAGFEIISLPLEEDAKWIEFFAKKV